MRISTIRFGTKKLKFIFSRDPKEWRDLIHRLSKRPDDYIYGVDIETATLPEHRADKWAALSPFTSQPRLLQIATEDTCLVFDLTGPFADLSWCSDFADLKWVEKDKQWEQTHHHLYGLGFFIDFLEQKKWTAHYAVFELGFFTRYAIRNRPDAHCTNLMAKLLLHASRPIDNQSLSLESLSKSELNVELPKGNQTSDWSQPLTWEQIIYAGMDAIATRELYFNLLPKIAEKKLNTIYTLVRRAQWPVVKMQLEGITVDEKVYKQHIIKWVDQLRKARNVLVEQFGFKRITGATIADYLKKNLDRKTLSIWPKTDGTIDKPLAEQKLKTDAHAFSEFGHLKIVKPIATYKKYDTLLSTFGQSLLDNRSAVTGKLHTRFNLLGARTGRLSSSEPNFQNFPRDKDIRSSFIPDGRDVFVVADYSQIEVRVAAEYSRDKALLNIYRKGLDVYKYTAAAVTGRDYESVTDAERQLGKALLLGMLYGLGAKKFGHYAKKGYGVDLTLDESYAYVQAFRDTYGGYYEWQQLQAENAQRIPHVVTTKMGKKRKLDKDNYYGASMNTPIQGTSAEIMELALCKTQKVIDTGKPFKLVSNIHDEIVSSCRRQFSLDTARIVNDSMIWGFQFVFPQGIINNLVEVGIGKSWGAAKSKENKIMLKSAVVSYDT